MISLTQLRTNLYSVFKILSSSGMRLDVVHKGIVYEVTILKTDKEPRLIKPKVTAAPQVLNVDMSICPECGSMMFNAICMNRECIHSTGSLLEVKAQLQPSL